MLTPQPSTATLLRAALVGATATLLAVGNVYLAAPGAAAATVVRVARPSGATTVSLTVGTDRVVGIDDRAGVGTATLWSRTVSSAGFGPEVVMDHPGATSVLVSAGRTAVVSGSATTTYDRGVVQKSIPSAATQLSGPYLISGGTVMRADGSLASFGSAVPETTVLFGSRTDNIQMQTSSIYVARRPIETGSLATFSVPTDITGCTPGNRWADAVLLSCPSKTFEVLDLTSTSSVLGGPTVVLDATPVPNGLGDGYALFKRPTGSTPYTLWNEASHALTDLQDCVTAPTTDHVGHVACLSATDIVWMDFSSDSTSAPRVLGYSSPAWLDTAATPTWTFAADTTKALAAGAVDIVAPDGSTVVRTLTTPASADGSLRVSWDGRDRSGTLVVPGRYVVRPRVPGADGSGTARSLDGTGSPETDVTVVAPGWSAFIQATYQDFFFHEADTQDIAGWSNYLTVYGSKTSYLTGIANNTTWLNAIVTKMYHDTLGRDPDQEGLAGWVNLLRTRQLTVAEVASKFYVSDEYYLRTGGTPTSWVTALYTHLLGRAPDAAGLQYWVDVTNKPGYGRHFVGFFFYQSTESRMTRVANLYQALLRRAPDPTGWPYWTQQVYTTGDITLAVNLADSLEYWLQAHERY